MWLLYVAVPLIVLAILAAALGGGIFTIVLVPLAVIAVVAAVWSAISARAASAPGAKRRSPTETGPGGADLPHSFARSPSTAPDSPESLADTRRELQ
jgi:hypothetical protein